MSKEVDQTSADLAQGQSSESSTAAGDLSRQQVEQACLCWQSDLKAFLTGVLKDPHQVEDVFQRSVLRAIASSETARRETLRGWLFRIALNEARQLHREQKRSALHFGRLAAMRPIEVAESSASGALSSEVISAVRDSLERLNPDQRNVIRRRLYENQTFAEIAAELNVPLGTVLAWMRRGMMKLRDDVTLRHLTNEHDDQVGGDRP